MKTYKINIKLKNGNEIHSSVVARNQADAMRRLEKNPEFVDFIGDSEISSVSIDPVPIKPLDNERFAVTTIDNKPGWYVIADLDNLLRVEFKKGRYNETNSVSAIGQGKELTALQAATALREIGEYLYNNFKELV